MAHPVGEDDRRARPRRSRPGVAEGRRVRRLRARAEGLRPRPGRRAGAPAARSPCPRSHRAPLVGRGAAHVMWLAREAGSRSLAGIAPTWGIAPNPACCRGIVPFKVRTRALGRAPRAHRLTGASVHPVTFALGLSHPTARKSARSFVEHLSPQQVRSGCGLAPIREGTPFTYIGADHAPAPSPQNFSSRRLT